MTNHANRHTRAIRFDSIIVYISSMSSEKNPGSRDFVVNVSLEMPFFEPPNGKTNIGENKVADQLRSNCEADQRLCFRNSDSSDPLLLKSEISRF